MPAWNDSSVTWNSASTAWDALLVVGGTNGSGGGGAFGGGPAAYASGPPDRMVETLRGRTSLARFMQRATIAITRRVMYVPLRGVRSEAFALTPEGRLTVDDLSDDDLIALVLAAEAELV